METLIKLLATFFYVGKFPFAPGTAASFAGLLLLISLWGHPWVSALSFVLILIVGFLIAGQAEKFFEKKDPPEVVIDEVCGIFIVFFRMPIHNGIFLGLGFLLYRLLDILKPFPAKRLQNLKGSYGIMLDDIVCAIYTNLILHIFLKTKLIFVTLA